MSTVNECLLSFESWLADAYLELGRFDDAAQEYRRVLGLNANYAQARFANG